MTTYLDPLQQYLAGAYPGMDQLWSYSDANRLGADWLVATPEDVWGKTYEEFAQAVPMDAGLADLQACTPGPNAHCRPLAAAVTRPGDQVPDLSVGHSWRIYDEMYRVMTSARVLLDFTTLTPPQGREMDAFVNALIYLSNLPEDQRPVVRILYSNPLPNLPLLTADAVMSKIVAALDPARKMEIYVTVMSSSFSSWNHSKIVAADGVEVLTGGHNMWGPHYLGLNPVFDVSMRATGTAARGAHLYAEGLWSYEHFRKDHLAEWVRSFVVSMHQSYIFDPTTGRCSVGENTLAPADLWQRLEPGFPAAPAGGTVPMLGVGRAANARTTSPLPTFFNWDQAFVEPSDQVFLKLIDMARRRVRMSLQALSLANGWVAAMNDPLFEAWGRAMARGVTVEVVLSNPGALAGGLGQASAPYYGEPPATINAKMLLILTGKLGLDTAAAQSLIRSRFRLGSFRYSAQATYPDGTQIANHAKTFLVDEAVFYIGSQNQYLSNLNEFGFLIEDPVSAAAYVAAYWDPLWQSSQPQGTSDFDDTLAEVQKMEALSFVLALDQDSRLVRVFRHLDDTRRAETDPARKAQTAELMNDVILNAGFATSVEEVTDTLDRVGPGADPSAEATPEAMRFVINLMKDPEMMRAFLDVVDLTTGGADALDAAMQGFLDARNYACTALQVRAALVSMRRQVLPYWSGSYQIWLTEDSGAAYTYPGEAPAYRDNLFFRRAQPVAMRTAAPTPMPLLSGTLVVRSETEVEYDGTPLKNIRYDGNVLSWEASEDNSCSGHVTFGQVTRPTLVDAFAGMECFGTLTYPDSGTSPRKGVVSLYGRVDTAAPPGPNPPSDVRWPFTLLYILGALSLLALAALSVKFLRDRAARNDWERRGRERRAREEENYIDMDDLAPVGTRNGDTEVALLTREGLRRRARVESSAIEELAKFSTSMTGSQSLSLESSATTLKESLGRLHDASVPDLPAVSRAEATVIRGVFDEVGSLTRALHSVLTDTARTNIRDNQTSSEAIGRDIDSWAEDHEEGKPIENWED